MKELFKEYLQATKNCKIIVSGDAFFVGYKPVEDKSCIVEEIFIGEKYQSKDSVLKIVNAIDAVIEGFGFPLEKIFFRLNISNPNFLALIEALLTLGFTKSKRVNTDIIQIERGD